jgi:hypothetical protein
VKGLRLVPLAALALFAPAAADSPAKEARVGADCSVRSTGLPPLTDLGRGRYRGQPGGLYPGGGNRPPRAYLRRGTDAARRVRPIGGRIVLLSVGVANASHEFRGFAQVAAQQPGVNRAVVLVDGARNGWSPAQASRPGTRYWAEVDRRLAQAGARPNQVQAIWLKEAIRGEDRPFPQDARALRAHLRVVIRIATSRFRNLRLVFVSSRTYAGYAISHLNPEPFAYESGYAVRWTVADGMAGRFGRVWVGWGPYLWTDGTRGRADGFNWLCEDVQADGTHPSPRGVQKVARLLLQFFTTDPVARPWFSTA